LPPLYGRTRAKAVALTPMRFERFFLKESRSVEKVFELGALAGYRCDFFAREDLFAFVFLEFGNRLFHVEASLVTRCGHFDGSCVSKILVMSKADGWSKKAYGIFLSSPPWFCRCSSEFAWPRTGVVVCHTTLSFV
ncbi:hypothetical protein KCU92_g38, partial [Aureobasidium melanogenum]